ncbi:O-antigen ligase family protein [uncultured Nostoc sp.]|uniref:O-antigen ligase family protein n=1 Tax=uncultured Nostoc sp. TaxID=340711 RepID=UPI0026283816|nr:O-antigen ligase family protein [uncultured Nostoc sp.]
MRKFLISAEQILTVTCLMIYSGTPLIPLLTDGFTVKDADRSIFRFFFTFTYIVSLSLIALRWKKVTYVFSRDKFIWALIGVCALSSFWSLDPDTTVRRVFALAATTIFGLYLASRYTLKEQLKLCAYMFGISAVMCFLFVIFLPQYGLGNAVDGAGWRGIYPSKNSLGETFVVSAAIFFFQAMTNQENRWVSWLGYVASGVLIFFSKSTTSIVNFIIITAAVVIYYRILHLKYKVMIPILTFISTIAIAFYTWFISEADTILGSVGKDTTLTGRSEIWSAVLEMIAKKPLLGYGYGAFWIENNSESTIVQQTIQWNAPNAHNGFLDLWLELGLLGFSVFLIGFVINLLKAIYLIRWNQTSESLWLLVYFTVIILTNLAETTFLEQNSVQWIFYVSAILSNKLSTRANL